LKCSANVTSFPVPNGCVLPTAQMSLSAIRATASRPDLEMVGVGTMLKLGTELVDKDKGKTAGFADVA
jgi:hypothetical protein